MLTRAMIEEHGVRVAFAILNFNGERQMRDYHFSRHPALFHVWKKGK